MKYLKWLLLTVCFACSFERYKNGRDSQDVLQGSPGCAPIEFSQVQSEIFGTPTNSAGKCLTCHQVGGKLMALDSFAAVKAKLAQIEDSIRTNRMPKNGPLPADKKQLLYNWIEQGAPEFARDAVPVETCNPTPLDPVDPVKPTLEPHYESLRKEIFASQCLGCHDGSGIFSFYDFSTYESLIAYKKLFDLPSDGSDSRFVNSLVTGSMPKNGKPLAPEQIEVVRQWVALGLPKTAADVGSGINPDEPCDLIDFKTVNDKVFEGKCTKCHDETSKLDLQTFNQIKSH
ncbi:hypothetical protein K2X05_11530, partial [bacterium]|nr:hypothetical protein [bacterium]